MTFTLGGSSRPVREMLDWLRTATAAVTETVPALPPAGTCDHFLQTQSPDPRDSADGPRFWAFLAVVSPWAQERLGVL